MGVSVPSGCCVRAVPFYALTLSRYGQISMHNFSPVSCVSSPMFGAGEVGYMLCLVGGLTSLRVMTPSWGSCTHLLAPYPYLKVFVVAGSFLLP